MHAGFGLRAKDRPQAHNLHGETAVRYQSATGNLSTEASKDSYVFFVLLIVNIERLVK